MCLFVEKISLKILSDEVIMGILFGAGFFVFAFLMFIGTNAYKTVPVIVGVDGWIIVFIICFILGIGVAHLE